MATSAKRKVGGPFSVLILMLLVTVGIGYYALLGDIEITFAQKPSPTDAQEAARKLKVLEDAQTGKKNGFVRLNEAEINSLFPNRSEKSGKDRTEAPVELVKVGVLLQENDITFVNWQSLSLFGLQFPLVWQRTLVPERNTNGWSLALRGMQIGKVRIPEPLWKEATRLLGATDRAFDARKAWLGTLPTVMLSRNEVSQKPELRLYTYVPVVKEPSNPLAVTQNLPAKMESTGSASGSTNTLTAKLTL